MNFMAVKAALSVLQHFRHLVRWGSALVVQINYRPEDFPDLLPEHQLRDADSLDIYAITGILPVSRAKHRIMCAVGKI